MLVREPTDDKWGAFMYMNIQSLPSPPAFVHGEFHVFWPVIGNTSAARRTFRIRTEAHYPL